jgi:threonine aldolase
MGNLVAQLAHLGRGQESIAGRQYHTVLDEAAGHAVIVGTSIRALAERPDGTIDLDEIRDAFRDPTDPHEPITGLVTLENTHAHSMAQPISPAYTAAVAEIAHEHGVPLHVDGARFWNAVVALGVDATELAGPADTVTFCLSKGLGCPVGSVLVGSRDVIWRARRGRKLVGGGMRQAGIIAAAGLIALRDGDAGMIDRLAEDHANAGRLAEALSAMPGILSPGDIAQPGDGPLDPGRVRTNVVLFRVGRDRAAFIEAVRAAGVLLEWFPHEQIRAATHVGIDGADIDRTIAAIGAALRATSPLAPPATTRAPTPA